MNLFKIAAMMLLLLSCNARNEPKAGVNSFKTTRFEDGVLDTILERNNPANLDLSRHQLFIDTTRDSEFYEAITNWEPYEFAIENYIQKKSFKKFSIGKFTREWVSLQKLNGNFVLYDRCDGIDRRFKITDSILIAYGTHEHDVTPIGGLLKLRKNEIELQFSSDLFFKIYPTREKNVYLLEYKDERHFVTPLEKIREFDLVVNHCPTQKEHEFDGFEELN